MVTHLLRKLYIVSPPVWSVEMTGVLSFPRPYAIKINLWILLKVPAYKTISQK